MATRTLLLVILCFYKANAENKLNDVLFGGNYEFIDLTYPFDEKTVYWPGSQHFTYTKKIEMFREDGTWYASNDFAAGEHGGTHIDAPFHFNMTGKQVGDMPLDKFIVPLIIADISSVVSDNPNFVLYKQHLDYFLNDNMGKPCVIIFKFGWSKYYNDTQKYLGINEKAKTLNFPGLSGEVAEWITTSYKNIVGVGVDVASVDPGSSTDFVAHKTLSKAGLYNIENVDLSKPVPDHGCTALVLPMKIKRGTGAPLRLVAICPTSLANKF